jgi:methylglutamate dehydrogenase subunit B
MNAALVPRLTVTEMRITCPHCGARALQEFSYAGSASVQRPAENAGQKDWHEFVHLRKNPRGLNAEYWQHIYGCRMVLLVERDTQTHEILDVKFAQSGEAA